MPTRRNHFPIMSHHHDELHATTKAPDQTRVHDAYYLSILERTGIPHDLVAELDDLLTQSACSPARPGELEELHDIAHPMAITAIQMALWLDQLELQSPEPNIWTNPKAFEDKRTRDSGESWTSEEAREFWDGMVVEPLRVGGKMESGDDEDEEDDDDDGEDGEDEEKPFTTWRRRAFGAISRKGGSAGRVKVDDANRDDTVHPPLRRKDRIGLEDMFQEEASPAETAGYQSQNLLVAPLQRELSAEDIDANGHLITDREAHKMVYDTVRERPSKASAVLGISPAMATHGLRNAASSSALNPSHTIAYPGSKASALLGVPASKVVGTSRPVSPLAQHQLHRPLGWHAAGPAGNVPLRHVVSASALNTRTQTLAAPPSYPNTLSRTPSKSRLPVSPRGNTPVTGGLVATVDAQITTGGSWRRRVPGHGGVTATMRFEQRNVAGGDWVSNENRNGKGKMRREYPVTTEVEPVPGTVPPGRHPQGPREMVDQKKREGARWMGRK